MTSHRILKIALTAALFIMTLATGCEKDPETFLPINEVPGSSEEAMASQLKTWDDTLQWIKEESVNYEVNTDYLNEIPDLYTQVSVTENIKVPSPMTGELVEMTAKLINGQLIAEGDMNFGTEAEYREQLERAESRGVISNIHAHRWPYGIIPYTIANNHPKKSEIETAIERINRETNLTVQPRNNEADYVHFPVTTLLNSWVGRRGGMQNININDRASVGNIIHEIFHAAGMFHEQSRCDRDDYVIVHEGNIMEGQKDQFAKICSGAIDAYSYNFTSIMHYGPDGFSKNGLFTITPRTLNPATWISQLLSMGQRYFISSTDKNTINYMYPFDYQVFVDGGTFALVPHHSRQPILASGKEGETMMQYPDNPAYAPYQRLKVIRASDGYYYIQHTRSGKYITIESRERGAKAILRNPANDARQQFSMEYAQDGLLRIRSRYSNLYLEIGGRSYNRGAQLNTWEYKRGDNQKFFFMSK